MGLSTGAAVVLLQGGSTYTALASAYFFARPVLRSQIVETRRAVLEAAESEDAEVQRLVETASRLIADRMLRERPAGRRMNTLGLLCLVLSFLLFTAAFALQVSGDPTLFRSA